MAAESNGTNPDLKYNADDVVVEQGTGHRYVLMGDIKYPIERHDPAPGICGAQYPSGKWRSGIVNVGFDDRLDARQRRNVARAFQMWEPAGISFVENNGHSDIAVFVNSSRDQSFPGKIGGKQLVEISNWDSITTIAHEIGHLIGLEHEQQRSDRDQYIDVKADVLIDAYQSQFSINSSARLTTRYDLGSIMHYAQELPASIYKNKISVPVFIVNKDIRGPNYRIGYAPRPTDLDIEAVRSIYANAIV